MGGFGVEEEAGGDSSSDLAVSLCQDFALPRLSPSLSLSPSHSLSALTHAEVQERNRELTGEFLGIVEGHLPSVGVRDVALPCTSLFPRARVLASSLSWGSGHCSASAPRPAVRGRAAAASRPRPQGLRPGCQSGRGGRRAARGFAGLTELAARRRRLPAPPAAAAPGGLPSLRTSVGLLPAPLLSLRFPNFLFFRGSARSGGGGCACVPKIPLAEQRVRNCGKMLT